jgi:hypothetical protein
MRESTVKYASECKCDCGKQAAVFVGLVDPDATSYPKCRDCADKWRMRIFLALSESIRGSRDRVKKKPSRQKNKNKK